MSLSAIPRPLRSAVAERDCAQCRYCHLRQVGQVAVFHVDHVVPKSKGGTTVIGNLALQCPHCSLRKSSKTEAVDPDTNAVVVLFHPLSQDWAEHFEQAEDARIVGRSPVGRATVVALGMNEPIAKVARAMQRRLGLS